MNNIDDSDIKTSYTATDVSEIIAALEGTAKPKKECESNLQELISKPVDLEARVESLESLQPLLHALSGTASQLNESIQSASTIADRVRTQVRVLDTAQSRLTDTISKVRDFSDLKRSLTDAENALLKGDLEGSVGLISRFCMLKDKPIFGEESDELKRLKEITATLITKVMDRLNEASRTENFGQVVKYCKLLAPLGQPDEGLSRYCKLIGRSLSIHAEKLLRELDAGIMGCVAMISLIRTHEEMTSGESQPRTDVNFVETVAKLYDEAAGILQEHEASIESAFGPGSIITAIQIVQNQCDTQGERLIDRFVRARRLPTRVQEHKVALNTLLNGEEDGDLNRLDPRELDPILDEIALFSARSEVFDNYLRNEARKALKRRKEGTMVGERREERRGESSDNVRSVSERVPEGRPDDTADGLIHISELNRRMQELMGAYLVLEEFFMTFSVKKAIALNQPSKDNITTTLLDDCFYILRKCTRRSLATRSADAICAILNHVNGLLCGVYIESLDKMFQIYSSSLGGERDEVGEKSTHISREMILNSMSISSEYTNKLKNEGSREVDVVLRNQLEVGKRKVHACLDYLTEASNGFKRLTETSAELLYSTALQPQLRPIIESFSQTNYQITEEEYNEYSMTDPFVSEACARYGVLVLFAIQSKSFLRLNELLSPCKNDLTEENLTLITGRLAKAVSRRLENMLFQKRVTQLGALQLDKDIRELTSFFAEKAARSTRTHFSRLIQICSLLNIDSPSEVHDLYGKDSSLLSWRLTHAEVKRTLALRTEFSLESISRLKL